MRPETLPEPASSAGHPVWDIERAAAVGRAPTSAHPAPENMEEHRPAAAQTCIEFVSHGTWPETHYEMKLQ